MVNQLHLFQSLKLRIVARWARSLGSFELRLVGTIHSIVMNPDQMGSVNL